MLWFPCDVIIEVAVFVFVVVEPVAEGASDVEVVGGSCVVDDGAEEFGAVDVVSSVVVDVVDVEKFEFVASASFTGWGRIV